MTNRILDWDAAGHWRETLRAAGRRLVFTNGCFDILHAGHAQLLERARAEGDALAVGLNDDDSVRRLKGPTRPVNNAADRAAVLAALRAVDAVVLFPDDTPLRLIELLRPDVLVKGGDYTEATIVGAEAVKRAGGKVVIVPLVEGRATTAIVDKIKAHG